jgi:hypothetical protein
MSECLRCTAERLRRMREEKQRLEKWLETKVLY